MIGYHHVLMIIIAVAIILLCKFEASAIDPNFNARASQECN